MNRYFLNPARKFRRDLDNDPERAATFCPPAYHKGDASQSQTATQTGAQDEGRAVSGKENTQLTDDAQLIRLAAGKGSSVAVNTTESGGLSIGPDAEITVTDGGAVNAALNAISQVTQKSTDADSALMSRILDMTDKDSADRQQQKTLIAVAALAVIAGLYLTRKS